MMKKKMRTLLLFMVIINFLFVNGNAYPQDNNIDSFQSILIETNCEIEEFGIKTSFETDGTNEEICVDLLKKLGFYEKASINAIKGNEMYCLEFNKDDTNGYIESINFDNHNVVTVNISKKNSANGLKELKEKIENATDNKAKNQKLFQYIKAKLPNSDISSVNSDVVRLLRKEKAENIATVKISNGYSTVAYTKNYKPMKNDGKLMDFNFAVCRYSSGNYLIMGTPVIITNY
ncbi:YwmB family TATA-box binding protein [Clostridium omnivorum]|nr:YwmB family TATA-box binding protein [Clostridium sp. E14]